jgi:Protein of unknown function (DUF2380)
VNSSVNPIKKGPKALILRTAAFVVPALILWCDPSARVRDIDSGKLMAGMRADVRGNTQESWSRALNYLVVDPLLGPGGL